MNFFKDERDCDQHMWGTRRKHGKLYCPMSDKLCKNHCVNYQSPSKYKILWWFFVTRGGCKFFARAGDKTAFM